MTRDVEDMDPHYVYRCFDAEDRLLYVGCAYDVDSRLKLHGLVRFHMVRYTTERHATKALARGAERAAITAEAPLFNRQHNPTRFKKVGAKFTLVAPVHPLTQWFHDQMTYVVTLEDMRAAAAALGELLPEQASR